MHELRKNGDTSVLLRIPIYDSASPTGEGLTGLLHSTTGLIISTICDNEASPTTYTSAGSTIETITTLGTYAAPTATKCRFKEVDATNHRGLYEIQLADARFAVANARTLQISITVPGGVQQDYTIQLLAVNLYDTVRAGLTALPNAAAEASGGLITRGTGTGQITLASGVVTANVTQFGGSNGTFAGGRPEVNTTHLAGTSQTARDIGASVLLSSGTGTGQVDLTSGVVKSNVTQFGGSAGTFSAGVPSVNTTQFAGNGVSVNGDGYPHVSVRSWRDTSVSTSPSLQTWASVGAVTTSIGTGAITSASFAAGAITEAAFADNAVTDAKVASDVTVKISSGTGTGQLDLSSGVVKSQLSPTGLDLLSIADPGPVAPTTFRAYLLAACRRFLAPSSLTSSELKMLGDNGVTVNLVQAVSDNGVTQTVGAAETP